MKQKLLRHTRSPWTRLALTPLALLCLPLSSFAQETDSDDEEVFTLSPFEVDGSQDEGYRATNTLSGTRLNAQLKDTSATVSSFTKAFLEDLGATDLESVVAYSASAETDIGDQSGAPSGNDNVDSKPAFNFRVRGFNASRTRDFFRYDLPVDVYNTERLDESRGPNSVLFGIGSPGGIINTTTKRANTNRDSTSIQLQIADENGQRVALDTNQVLVEDRLGIRFNLLVDNEDGWRYNTKKDEKRFHGAVTFKATENTTIRAEAEFGEIDDVVARPFLTTEDFSQWDGTTYTFGRLGGNRTTLPQGVRPTRWFGGANQVYINNDVTIVDQLDRPETDNNFFTVADFGAFGPWWNGATATSTVPDQSLIPASVNLGGPGSQRDLDFNIYTLSAEQQFGDLYVELAYQRNESDWVSHWTSGATVRIDPNETRIDGSANPYVGQYYVEGLWDRRTRNLSSDTFRATFAYELETDGAGRHDLLLLLSHDSQNQGFTNETLGIQNEDIRSSWGATPDNIRYRPLFRQYFSELGDWENFHVPSWENAVQGVSTLSDARGGGRYNDRSIDLGWNIRDANQNDDTIDNDAVVFGAQSYWMNNKLVTTVGYRYDDFTQNSFLVSRDASGFFAIDRDSPTTSDFSVENIQAGAVYHVNENISVFYNTSENTSFPNFLIRTLPADLSRPITAGTPDPGEGEGWDTGVMFELFEGKFSGRLTYYEASKLGDSTFRFGNRLTSALENGILNGLRNGGFIDQATVDQRRINSNGSLFDEESDGFEFTSTANVTKNWRLNFNASYTDRIRSNSYNDAQALLENSREYALSLPGVSGLDTVYDPNNGQTLGQYYDSWQNEIDFVRAGEEVKRGLRKIKANVFTAYDFKEGGAKGLTIGGGLRYQDANIVGVDAAGNVLEGSALEYADLLVRYRFPQKLFGSARASLQLNVNNLFDKDGIIPVRYTPVPNESFSDPRFVDVATFHQPRTYRLTLNLKM